MATPSPLWPPLDHHKEPDHELDRALHQRAPQLMVVIERVDRIAAHAQTFTQPFSRLSENVCIRHKAKQRLHSVRVL